MPSGTDQSSRARPPELVSPETPALATSTARPLALSACSSCTGNAALPRSWKPAVSESPSATTLMVRSAALRRAHKAAENKPGNRERRRKPLDLEGQLPI